MTAFADEVLALVCPGGVKLADVAKRLAADTASVRAAFLKLDADGRAIAARARAQGRAWRLLPLGDKTPVCKICHQEFVRPRKSKRVTCSRVCWGSLAWRDPELRQKRVASIRRQKDSVDSRAQSAAANNVRWAKPGAREKLAHQSRERWADPVMKAKMSAAIHAVQSSPEMRALYSKIRKAQWDDPEGRKRLVEGIRLSKSTPEAKALFSKLLRERWKDPAMRRKYTEGNRKRNQQRKANREARV